MGGAIAREVVCGLAACAVVYGCSSDDASPPPSPVVPTIDSGVGVGSEEDTGVAPGGCVPDPANFDIPGNNCDDDGDGMVNNRPTCDEGLEEQGDAEEFAKTLGLCRNAAKGGAGVVSAVFTQGYAVTAAPPMDQHAILPKFGDVLVPREGKRLGVLSTGFAQEFNGHPGFTFGGGDSMTWDSAAGTSEGRVPGGFPRPVHGCELASDVHDVVNLKLTLRAPKNATGLAFDFNFLSGEWPAFICSRYNDSFIAFLSAKGFNDDVPDNMSFDLSFNTFSVNSTAFDCCTPGVETGCSGARPKQSVCPSGPGELAGTGFGVEGSHCGGQTSTGGGGTGWLTSRAPITRGEVFTLELIIFDTGDGQQDSSVLLDNFRWLTGEVTAMTERPSN